MMMFLTKFDVFQTRNSKIVNLFEGSNLEISAKAYGKHLPHFLHYSKNLISRKIQNDAIFLLNLDEICSEFHETFRIVLRKHKK